MEEQIRLLEERIQRERYRQEELIRELQNLHRRNFNSNYMLRTLSDYVTLLRDHFRTTENPLTRLPSMRRRFNDMLVVCECCSITLSRFRSTPWQIIDFRFRFTVTVPLPHLERTPVAIRGRRRTQLASRPQVRRQVIREHRPQGRFHRTRAISCEL